MQHQHDFTIPPPEPIVIQYESGDELEHLPPYFFCSEASCPCHQDALLTAVLQAMLDAQEITSEQALPRTMYGCGSHGK